MKSLAAGFKGEVAVVDFSNDILSEFFPVSGTTIL